LAEMQDRELATLYDYEVNGDLPYMLTKNTGASDWMVNKYMIRFFV